MDPSSSSEIFPASINANQPEQTETFTRMDRDSYNAAVGGRIGFFKDITDIDGRLTPNKNTVLHIYITTLTSGSKSTTISAGSESTTTLDAAGSESTSLNARPESTTNFVKRICKEFLSLLRKDIAQSESASLDARPESTTNFVKEFLKKFHPVRLRQDNAQSESITNCMEKILRNCHSLLRQDKARSESTTDFVEEILNKCHSLLWHANAKGETPLHIAARYGHADIVEFLIKYCAQTPHDQDPEVGIEPVKKMLSMMNKEKDTALHEAVRYNHLEVVELLIKEDPNFSYSANAAGETPLYIAAERKFHPVLFKILDKCNSPMHGGPLGRTALHATVIWNDKVMTRRILDKIEGISREVDNNGWTPLHFAAYFGHSRLATLLLDIDKEVAYMKDAKDRTALHIAAQRGHVGAMESIVSSCPDCCELVDNKGWTALHFAMKCNLSPRHWKIILKNPSLRNLLNEKNDNGDTPLHYYSNSLASVENFVHHPRVDKMAFNKQNLSAYDIASTNAKLPLNSKMLEIMDPMYQAPLRVISYEDDTTKLEEKNNEDKDKGSMLRKAANAHLIVAVLITTVTFAACISMPGGFVGGEDSHPGSALLKKKAAFKAFIITATISMVFSSSAVFIHLLIPILIRKYYDEKIRENLIFLAFILIFGAMVAMVLAFVTGTYAVLVPSQGLAIANCIIGLTFFAIILLVFRQVVGPPLFDLLLLALLNFYVDLWSKPPILGWIILSPGWIMFFPGLIMSKFLVGRLRRPIT